MKYRFTGKQNQISVNLKKKRGKNPTTKPFWYVRNAECLENGGWFVVFFLFFCCIQLGLNMTGNSGIWAGVVKVSVEIHDVMLDRACQGS